MQGIFAIVLIFILQGMSFTGIACAGDSTSFNPVPIAIEAHGTVPVGTVIAWPTAQNPEEMNKWLECNGQAILQAKYPQLYAKVGGRTPNYYNQFMRGGTLAEVGQVVADSTRSHAHGQPAHTHSFSGVLASTAISGTAAGQKYYDEGVFWEQRNHNVASGDVGIGYSYVSSIAQWRTANSSSVAGNLNNGSVIGSVGSSGGDETHYTGGAETAPQHIRVRYLIRALP